MVPPPPSSIRPSLSVRVRVSPSMEVGVSPSPSMSAAELSTASSDSNMDCVGDAMAGDSSDWDSTSAFSADSAMLGSLSANTLGRRPTTSANTSRKAKSRLWILIFV